MSSLFMNSFQIRTYRGKTTFSIHNEYVVYKSELDNWFIIIASYPLYRGSNIL